MSGLTYTFRCHNKIDVNLSGCMIQGSGPSANTGSIKTILAYRDKTFDVTNANSYFKLIVPVGQAVKIHYDNNEEINNVHVSVPDPSNPSHYHICIGPVQFYSSSELGSGGGGGGTTLEVGDDGLPPQDDDDEESDDD